MNQIYLLHEKSRANFKIGSTSNFNNRIGGYITCCDYFDSSTHYIELFDIKESKYNCYQLDWVIQQLSSHYSYPFTKCFGTGGKEFYKLDDWAKLATFFDNINVKYQRTIIDIDNLKKNNNITPIDYANTEIIDSTNFNSHSVNIDELNLIVRNLNLDTKLELKKFQSDIRNIFNSHKSSKSRLEHLVISPTGTGKTIIFTLMACDSIIKNKKDIMIITKKKEIIKYLVDIKTNIIKTFNTMFEIKLKPEQIQILNSHGLKSNSKFKISWHIIIKGYWFSSNSQCAYVCEKLKELDDSFDMSVYSKDRLMRTYGSAKDWKDQRILRDENETKPNITNLPNYLITNIEPGTIKLKCSREIKKEVEKKKYIRTHVDKKIKPDEIGHQIESILKTEYHEDTYYTKSTIKYENIQFYGFNYTNRKQKCFTGFAHDELGFYCWIDSCANIILKCFSQKCAGCKKIIGNLNKSNSIMKALEIESDYLNKSEQVNKLLALFEKMLLIK